MSDTVYRPHIISNFFDRLLWMAQNTPHDPSRVLESKTDFMNAIQDVAGIVPRHTAGRANFFRLMADEAAVPYLVIQAILEIFPCVTVKALTAPTFDAFLEHMQAYKSEMERWTDLIDFIAKNRAPLEQAGKAYHRDVDYSLQDSNAPPGFPLITAPGWLLETPQRLTREDPFEPLVTGHDPEGPTLFQGRGNYIHAKLRHGKAKRWHNGPTYRVHSITPADGKLIFQFSPGKYFNYVNTCEYRAAKLAEAFIKKQDLNPSILKERGAPGDIFDFSNRSAPPGINCVLLLKGYQREGGKPKDEFVMHLRGTGTLEAQNTNHVVPAGGHAPFSAYFKGDWEQRIWNTVAREFLEELFSKGEAGEIHESGDNFFENKEVKPLDDIFFSKEGIAAIHLLGVGLDPLTTKPEVLVAITIDWQKALTRAHSKGIKLSVLKFEANNEGIIRYRDLSEENLVKEVNHSHDNKPVLPAGAACLLLASKHFKILYGAV